MSRKHKFYNIEELNFVRFATVYWLDIMVWEQYFSESSEERKNLELLFTSSETMVFWKKCRSKDVFLSRM
jgi:hypothetical protein